MFDRIRSFFRGNAIATIELANRVLTQRLNRSREENVRLSKVVKDYRELYMQSPARTERIAELAGQLAAANINHNMLITTVGDYRKCVSAISQALNDLDCLQGQWTTTEGSVDATAPEPDNFAGEQPADWECGDEEYHAWATKQLGSDY